MRIIELTKVLWKSPVHKIMLLLMAFGFVVLLVIGTLKDDTFALFSVFLIIVIYGEMLWFTNIIEGMKEKTGSGPS